MKALSVFRNAARLPHLERAAEGVLYNVFCQREVVHAEDARERGDHPSRLMSEQMVVELA